ncbi:PREDICTED: diacylglycerol O-acyltransferase 2-like [Pygoscelis adeliae]|uniref:diacylglycerol O-acyltransferase 2-like n=1 Tax=Pygoscelis adeliae TaxID=9238 RepID=UPI0004F50AC9|nr:PREDICTED: diacylglycerol O-acyltransferase 2-like [Pygoscelis adeliae]
MKTIIAACSQNLSGSRASIQTTLRTLLAAPWPSQRDIRSWLQLLSVLQWVLSFLLLGTISLLLLIYLVFTSFWPISALYLAWIIFDWDTPEKGRAIGYLLSKNGTGNAVAIVVGGAAESLSCHPGVTTLILKNRKGFVRMALQHGAHLVPSFSFGENDLFHQVVFEEGSWMRSIQHRFQKMMGFAPCIFYGRGLTSVRSWGFLPYARPITTVAGEPVMVPKIEDPSCEMVDMYHEMYVRSLLKLFDENKTKYGLSEADELHIL